MPARTIGLAAAAGASRADCVDVATAIGGRPTIIPAEGGAGAHVYPDIPAGGSLETDTAGWTELRADASLFGEWRIKDSIGINATLRYGGNFTDKSITVPDPDEPGGTSQNRLKWQQFEAFLGARWFM